MTTTNDGGPAFPQLHMIDGNWQRSPDPAHAGMSLRANFAGQAMAAIVGSITSDYEYQRLRTLALQSGLPSVSAWIARDSVKQADALIAALEAKP